MAVELKSGASADLLTIEALTKAARVVMLPRGAGYNITTLTGTIAAALGALSSVFVMRLDPASPTLAIIEKIIVDYTTIVAYTTPLTANRRLSLYRGSGAAASGGTAVATLAKKKSDLAASEFDAAAGGDVRVSTTGALTVTGITYEAAELASVYLTPFGTAGANHREEWRTDSNGYPIVVKPGELLAIRNPVAMDAAGTWQIMVQVDLQEIVLAAY